MSPAHKPLVWLSKVIKTPPLLKEARVEVGYLLRLLQSGESIGMPHSRPMPSIGKRTHEIRVVDKNLNWRIFYRIDHDGIVIMHWTAKKTQSTAKKDIEICKQRLKFYDEVIKK
ncbi:Type II toxin-antitoxin system RelE/ParE family toxin [Candidatus Magnetomoraceae bacterium gMMP-15]